MARIYVSSTFRDLKDYREKVSNALQRMGHRVIAMENYVATDQRPLEKCLADVAACDLYLGIFAWKYGYIPHKDNPEGKSITELEYRKAAMQDISQLIFILDEEAPWPSIYMDSQIGEGNDGKSIKELREELMQESMVSFFKTADELAGLVSQAVYLWEEGKRKGQTAGSSVLQVASLSTVIESDAVIQQVSQDLNPPQVIFIEQIHDGITKKSSSNVVYNEGIESETSSNPSDPCKSLMVAQESLEETLDIFIEEGEIWPDQCDDVAVSLHLIGEVGKELYRLLDVIADKHSEITLDPQYYPMVMALNYVTGHLDELTPLIADMREICQSSSEQEQIVLLKEQMRDALKELSQDFNDIEVSIGILEKFAD